MPLSEANERYDVEILDGTTVVNTVRCETPDCSYSAAQQIADFGSLQANLMVRVSQLSVLVGRGITATAVV